MTHFRSVLYVCHTHLSVFVLCVSEEPWTVHFDCPSSWAEPDFEDSQPLFEGLLLAILALEEVGASHDRTTSGITYQVISGWLPKAAARLFTCVNLNLSAIWTALPGLPQ